MGSTATSTGGRGGMQGILGWLRKGGNYYAREACHCQVG